MDLPRTIALFCWSLAFMLAVPVSSQAWEPSTAAELKRSLQGNQHLYEQAVHMRMVTHINAYLSTEAQSPHERSTSTLWRMGDHYKVDYMGVTTYQDQELRVTVDSERRSILVGIPSDPMAVVRGGLQDSVLARVSRIGRQVRPDGMLYRIMFDGLLGYDAVEVYFDRAGWMRRMELHWAQEVDLRYRDPSSPRVRPRVVMELGVPERLTAGSVMADPRKVVELHANGPVGIGPWKGYEVFDTRVP